MILRNLTIIIDLNGDLILQKKKSKKYIDIIVYIFVALSFVLIIMYQLFQVGFKLKEPLLGIIILSIGLISLIIFTYYKIKRSIINNKDFVISNKNSLIKINQELFCSQNDFDGVLIKESTNKFGAKHYNVGLASKNKFAPLSLYHSFSEAEKLASVIGHYLNGKISRTESNLLIE